MDETASLEFLELPAFAKWVKKNRLRSAVETLKDELAASPAAGDVIPGGSGLRKVRMAGLGRGKSGGFRVTYLLLLDRTTAVLMAGYSKSEKEDLSADELKAMAKQVAGVEATFADEQPESEGEE